MNEKTTHPFEDMMKIMQAYGEQLQKDPVAQQGVADMMLFWQTFAKTMMAQPPSPAVPSSDYTEILSRLTALEKRMAAVEGRLAAGEGS